jgi:hypothetical protein
MNRRLFLSAFLVGCASTQMQQVERAPEFHSDRIHKVLIVAVAVTPERREAFEKEFKAQWEKRGVEAALSYLVFPQPSELNKRNLAPYARDQHFDAVLVGRLLKRGAVQSEPPGSKGERPPDLDQDLQVVVAAPQNDIDYEMAVISTRLYDVATEKPVWSGTSQTLLISGNVQERIRPFVKTVLKSLYEKPK